MDFGEHSETGSNIESFQESEVDFLSDFSGNSTSQPIIDTSSSVTANYERLQEEKIAQKVAAEEKKRQEYLEEAKASIEKFFADREKQREQKVADNMEGERLFLEQRDQEVDSKSKSWERAIQMVDFSVKPEQDISRIKQVMLKLQYQEA
eukprot:TRINITY_DN120_c0_g1_i1.p1 TRINITY_DN120_c0_g1~~TRINITY_DN120_c0_g1_i1.p1  ORF type:complete len:150 (+),score=52.44 TRINITY_DN120_c0_g1_i1:66-515(+)